MPPKDIINSLPDLTTGNRGRDADSVIRVMEMLSTAILPEWTDRSHADPGIALIQLFAYMQDHILWQTDRGMTDAIITQTTKRSVAVPMAEALGYKVDGAVAAVTTLRFTLAAPLAFDLIIPKGTQVQGTHKGVAVKFETDVQTAISQGLLVTTVAASHGFKTVGAALATSNGEPYQKYVLPSKSILKNRNQNSVVIQVAADKWTEVSSFANSLSTSKHYVVLRDHLDNLTALFGDGNIGAVPPFGAAITVDYREGGGLDGNVPASTIDTVNDGLPAVPAVTNTTPAQGGSVRQTLDSIKIQAPPFFATQNRAVTSADFNVLSSAISGVLRAQAVRTAINHIRVRVVPNDWNGDALNAAIGAAIQTELDSKRMVTDVVSTTAAIPVRPRLSLSAVVRPGRQQSVIRAAVQAALTKLYNLTTALQFGNELGTYSLYFSDLVAAVDNVDGVDHVDVLTFTRVPLLLGLLSGGWDIAAGDATISSISVGDAAVRETWNVVFTGATAFTVQGSVSGMQAAVGVVGAVYSSDSGEVGFTITAGATAMAAGNRGRFRTSRIVDNIPVGAEEHPVYRADLDLDLEVVGGVP